MREPVFNETLQLGIVVRDLEATMRRYVGARVAYLGADRDLGVVIEIFSGIPGDHPQPDEMP